MTKSQIAVRIPQFLLQELNQFVQKTNISKTDVVVNTITSYLNCPEKITINQRISDLERRIARIETDGGKINE
jgi:metal-responsive CopG/Arc/MetJ family transcriptional regulator